MVGNGPENRDTLKEVTPFDSTVPRHASLAQWQSLPLKPEKCQFDSDGKRQIF